MICTFEASVLVLASEVLVLVLKIGLDYTTACIDAAEPARAMVECTCISLTHFQASNKVPYAFTASIFIRSTPNLKG